QSPASISPLSLHDALPIFEVPTALHFFGIAADHGFCGIAWRHRVPFGFRLTLIYLPLFLENTQLTKAAHPILCVPGSNNFPVFEDRKSTRLNSSHVKISYA